MKEAIKNMFELSNSVVTAAIPVVQAGVNTNDSSAPESLSSGREFVHHLFDESRGEFTDIIKTLGLDMSNSQDLAIVVGAFQTATFVVAAATLSGDSPFDLWQWYINYQSE